MEDSWLTRLQDISSNLKMGVNESCKGGRTFLLGLLGPIKAGPQDDDGWFASDFALAHLLYEGIVDEQCWLTSVDLLEEVEMWGPYLWGHPKEDRIVVFSKEDSKFYSVCSSHGLIPEFKRKLQEMTASMGNEDRLVLLIFAHGENAHCSGILVGAGIYDGFGILTAEEVNDLLHPLSRGLPTSLITSACYSGVWADGAATCDEESLSFPFSNSESCRGGYFWRAVWYELRRLGVWVVGKEISKDDTFRSWSDNIKQRIQHMFMFHPIPTVFVPEEEIWENWEKHAKEVLCYNMEGDISSIEDHVGDPNVHFTGGYMKVLYYPLFERLPCLMKYLSTCNLGLPNAANNIEVFQLAQSYQKGLASKDQIVKLDMLLGYRVLEDWRAEKILNFLRIPRVCSIYNFQQWKHRGPTISPYVHVVNSIMPFGDPPKMTYRYTKPVTYVAWTAYMAKVDVEWFKTNLCLCVQSRSSDAGCVNNSSPDIGETSGVARETRTRCI